jgi:hypothetical protein
VSILVNKHSKPSAVATITASLLAAAVGLLSASALAQPLAEAGFVLLSDEYGGRGYIGMIFAGPNVPAEPIESFEAKQLSGQQISSAFAQLCLAKPFDRPAYEAARNGALPEFRSVTIRLPDYTAAKPLFGSNKLPATEIVQERSPYGMASLWLGEGFDALPNRFFLRYSGGLVITGPVTAKDLYAPQCNLTARVSGLTSSQALLDGIAAAATGFTLNKRVDKPKYGFGTWTKTDAGGRIMRISVNANNLHKAAQTVHLTIQLLPAAKAK